jgi:hypothetical protein
LSSKKEKGRAVRRSTGSGTKSQKGMMEMASYSQPINRSDRRNNLLHRKLRAAIDHFIGDNDQARAVRKAREADPEYPEAILTIISDILKTKL